MFYVKHHLNSKSHKMTFKGDKKILIVFYIKQFLTN